MKEPKTSAPTPRSVVDRLLKATEAGEVLVGGQSLAFWTQRFGLGLPAGYVAISHDTDFLARRAGDKAAVQRFADVVNGRTVFPHERAMTALVGMAILDLSDDEFINVDVIHSVIGLTAAEIRKWAIVVEDGDLTFAVMHPLHVLRSRLANLYKLREKQNAKGRMQLALAIDVVREYMRAEVGAVAPAALGSRSPIQRLVKEVEQMAVEDAGRKIAKRDGLHVADAIDPALIPAGLFWTKRWPTLRTLMSPGYAARFSPPPTTLTVEDAPVPVPVPSRARRRQPTSGGARRPR